MAFKFEEKKGECMFSFVPEDDRNVLEQGQYRVTVKSATVLDGKLLATVVADNKKTATLSIPLVKEWEWKLERFFRAIGIVAWEKKKFSLNDVLGRQCLAVVKRNGVFANVWEVASLPR